MRELFGVKYSIHPEVYEPSDDTVLLLRCMDPAPSERCLDVGTGVGVAAIFAARAGAKVCATDVNPHAVRVARWNARENDVSIGAVLADLDGPFRTAFDLVTFNFPYLPTTDDDHVQGPLDKAFDGGPDGLDVLRRFLPTLRARLAPDGRALIVFSSLADPERCRSLCVQAGFRVEVAASEAFPMEKVYVYRLTHAPARTI